MADPVSCALSTETGFLQLRGGLLEYLRCRPDTNSRLTLVLLHEGLGSVSLWRDFPEQLARASGCEVLAYSRFGYGNSTPVTVPRPLSYMHDEALEVLPAVLDQAGGDELVLVGHSDGGSIALINAGGVDDSRVRGLALMAPHVFVEQLSVDSIRASREQYESGDLRQRLRRFHGDNVDCAFRGWNRAWLDPQFLHWNIEEYLPRIQRPILVIQGLDDQYGTDLQLQSIEAHSAGPVQLARLADCGHAPWRDQPERTLELISDFVGRLQDGEAR